MAIDIQIHNQTNEAVDHITLMIKEVVNEALKQENLAHRHLECSYILVTDEQIRQINHQYRQKNVVTDVISFAVEEASALPILGDVFISIPRAQAQAQQYGHSFERELSFLALHGFLHLLGYNHLHEAEAKVMFNKQEDILDALKIKR